MAEMLLRDRSRPNHALRHIRGYGSVSLTLIALPPTHQLLY